MGEDFAEQAKLLADAKRIAPSGKLSWIPNYATGKAAMGATTAGALATPFVVTHLSPEPSPRLLFGCPRPVSLRPSLTPRDAWQTSPPVPACKAPRMPQDAPHGLTCRLTWEEISDRDASSFRRLSVVHGCR